MRGVSGQTCYRWKYTLAGKGVAEWRRRLLEGEPCRLNPQVADLTSDPPTTLGKPVQRGELGLGMLTGFQVRERRVCHVMSGHRATNQYRSVTQDQTALRLR
jgi:hypothetical protein